jgi:hypothetical protein
MQMMLELKLACSISLFYFRDCDHCLVCALCGQNKEPECHAEKCSTHFINITTSWVTIHANVAASSDTVKALVSARSCPNVRTGVISTACKWSEFSFRTTFNFITLPQAPLPLRFSLEDPLCCLFAALSLHPCHSSGL